MTFVDRGTAVPKPISRPIFEYALPALTLLVLIVYSFVEILAIPYTGFEFNPSNGRVISIMVEKHSTLRPGDRLLQVGAINWDRYSQDLRQPLFHQVTPGDEILLRIERDGEEINIPWMLPGFNLYEVIDRFQMLWLPYVFWLAGTVTFLFLRPKDIRWHLLIAFNYLTALWLIMGLVSISHIWYSAVIMRMAIWLCVPVYLHLHWVFPLPLRELPFPYLLSAYLFAGVLATMEWLGWLPKNAYFIAILIALLGSISLLILHAIIRPIERRDLVLLLLAVLLFVLPTIALGIASLIGSYPWYGGGALLALPALSGAYIYAVYRRQLGGLELRANRAIALLVFGVLLFTLSVLVLPVFSVWVQGSSGLAFITVVLILLTGLLTASKYPVFQSWVERRILGMPLPPNHLLQSYASRITTSLETDRLVCLLRDEILPSLLIRQAALIRLGTNPYPVLQLNVSASQLPGPAEIPVLLSQAENPRSTIDGKAANFPCSWARLILPLVLNEQVTGLFLLGRRDPDDYYAPTEIPTLQALTNQTAIALLNIEQASNLRSLHQVNIERQERERNHLALELHDSVLSQMAILAMNADENQVKPQFWNTYKETVHTIWEMIGGLRPRMLSNMPRRGVSGSKAN